MSLSESIQIKVSSQVDISLIPEFLADTPDHMH